MGVTWDIFGGGGGGLWSSYGIDAGGWGWMGDGWMDRWGMDEESGKIFLLKTALTKLTHFPSM